MAAQRDTRVLGIDPGSRYCGVGVVDDAGGGRVRHVHHGVIKLSADAPLEDRLVQLHTALEALIDKLAPSFIAVEELYFAKNARSALVLGHARGVALLAARQSGAEVRSYPASVIKQAVTGSGRAEKEQVGRMVTALLGISLAGERADASDALAAALCGVLRAKDPNALLRKSK
ncbi:MAG: crossover junction endodeoxyribonuclease RuvC [Deltaproteobacteria bacterium]|nr:crossover junction endodeoxyribonuclease RuvC [Deltaproteobacteria bacterium]